MLYYMYEYALFRFNSQTMFYLIFLMDSILRAHKLIPLIVPHYNALSSTIQKLTALALRSEVQARDIFDLYIKSQVFALRNSSSFVSCLVNSGISASLFNK
jgi:hypothetical protein